MVVDDDGGMRAVLRDFLTREGFRIHEAAEGAAMVAALEWLSPAAIVLDKEMPGLNGLDLLSYLAGRHPSIPVIVITAFGGPEVRAEALHRGATGYIEKPFGLAALVGGLRALADDGPAR